MSVAGVLPADPVFSSPSLSGMVFMIHKVAASKSSDRAAGSPEDGRSVKGWEEHSRAHQLIDRFQQ